MTLHPNDINTVHLWKQDEIILWILEEHSGVSMDVVDLQQHMIALGYPARKYKKATLQTVLSRLSRQGKINRSEKGEYYLDAT